MKKNDKPAEAKGRSHRGYRPAAPPHIMAALVAISDWIAPCILQAGAERYRRHFSRHTMWVLLIMIGGIGGPGKKQDLNA